MLASINVSQCSGLHPYRSSHSSDAQQCHSRKMSLATTTHGTSSRKINCQPCAPTADHQPTRAARGAPVGKKMAWRFGKGGFCEVRGAMFQAGGSTGQARKNQKAISSLNSLGNGLGTRLSMSSIIPSGAISRKSISLLSSYSSRSGFSSPWKCNASLAHSGPTFHPAIPLAQASTFLPSVLSTQTEGTTLRSKGRMLGHSLPRCRASAHHSGKSPSFRWMRTQGLPPQKSSVSGSVSAPFHPSPPLLHLYASPSVLARKSSWKSGYPVHSWFHSSCVRHRSSPPGT